MQLINDSPVILELWMSHSFATAMYIILTTSVLSTSEEDVHTTNSGVFGMVDTSRYIYADCRCKVEILPRSSPRIIQAAVLVAHAAPAGHMQL